MILENELTLCILLDLSVGGSFEKGMKRKTGDVHSKNNIPFPPELTCNDA